MTNGISISPVLWLMGTEYPTMEKLSPQQRKQVISALQYVAIFCGAKYSKCPSFPSSLFDTCRFLYDMTSGISFLEKGILKFMQVQLVVHHIPVI
jgi:hypothetical protein